jgi:hypothetical protein
MKALNRGGNDNEILRVFTSGGFANLPVSRANAYRSHKPRVLKETIGWKLKLEPRLKQKSRVVEDIFNRFFLSFPGFTGESSKTDS